MTMPGEPHISPFCVPQRMDAEIPAVMHIGGYLKSPAKSVSDQGVCGDDMSLPNGTCETRNTKSGSEKRIDPGHVGNIISGAAETPLYVSSPKARTCGVYSKDIENRTRDNSGYVSGWPRRFDHAP
jgi:hypothetical protein